MKTTSALLFLFALLTLPLRAATFTGTDGNWHDPDNWDTGVVPNAATDVTIPAGTSIRLEPVAGPLTIQVRDLLIDETGILTVAEGVNFRYRLSGSRRLQMFSRQFGPVPNLLVDPPGSTTVNPAHGWIFDSTNRVLWHNGDLPHGGSAFMGSYLNQGAANTDPTFYWGTVSIAITANTSGAGGILVNLGNQIEAMVDPNVIPQPALNYDLMTD